MHNASSKTPDNICIPPKQMVRSNSTAVPLLYNCKIDSSKKRHLSGPATVSQPSALPSDSYFDTSPRCLMMNHQQDSRPKDQTQCLNEETRRNTNRTMIWQSKSNQSLYPLNWFLTMICYWLSTKTLGMKLHKTVIVNFNDELPSSSKSPNCKRIQFWLTRIVKRIRCWYTELQ